MSTSMGKSLAIGGTIGGASGIGFLSGIAATSGVATVICPPAGIILGGAIAVGTGLGALAKAIFDWYFLYLFNLISLFCSFS